MYNHNLTYPKERAIIFKLCYIYFREIDDIIDGDKILFSNTNFYENKKLITEYIYKRRDYLETNCILNTTNELDEIIKTIVELSNYIELNLIDYFLKLLDCMLFDLKRKCNLKNGEIILNKTNELEEYNFKYYCDSCIKIAILLTTPTPQNIEIKNIQNLGYAQRIYFNLEDFFEDLSYGLINISWEDFNSLGINEESLITIANSPKRTIDLCKKRGFNNIIVLKQITPEVMTWLNSQLNLGIKYLKSYQKEAPLRTPLSISNEILFQKEDFSNIILRLGIERGTNQYFTKLLKQQKTLQSGLNR